MAEYVEENGKPNPPVVAGVQPRTVRRAKSRSIVSVGGKVFKVKVSKGVLDDNHVHLVWEDRPAGQDGDALFTWEDARTLGVAILNASWELRIVQGEV